MFIEELRPRYSLMTYDILENNCNAFSEEVSLTFKEKKEKRKKRKEEKGGRSFFEMKNTF